MQSTLSGIPNWILAPNCSTNTYTPICMRTFKIQLSSWINYVLTFFIVIGVTISTVPKLFSNKTIGTLISVFIIMIAIYYLTKITATVLTIWTVKKEVIHVKWVKQFLFHKKRPDLTINWEEIKAYKLGNDKVFDRFKLILKDGTVFRFWHDKFITKDDFNKFIYHFNSKVEAHNQQELQLLEKHN